MMYRLPPVAGEWIDRSRELEFEFEGRAFQGFAGDTIVERARGGGRDDARPQLQVPPAARHPLVRQSRRQQAVPGRTACRTCAATSRRSQTACASHAVNTVGGLARDRARFVEWLAPFLPVGFYYKAFHGREFPALGAAHPRDVAGSGRIDADAPRVRTPKRYAFCDVLVIGAGPSGLAAALSAADAGARVLLVDENARAGGSGRWSGASADEIERLRRSRRRDAAASKCLPSTFAAGYYADHWVALVEPTRMTKVRARRGGVRHGRHRAAGRVPQQRSARRDVGLGGAAAAASLCASRPASASRSSPRTAKGYELARVLRTHGMTIAARARSARGLRRRRLRPRATCAASRA